MKKQVEQLPASTRRELARITRGVPRHLERSLTKEVIDTEEEDRAREMLKSPDIDPRARRKIERMIKAGKFRTSEVVVDEEVATQIERYHETEVAKAIRSGKLPDPRSDPFTKRRSWHERNRS